MYEIKKTFDISAAHRLVLDYDSPCTVLHGHNWRITVHLRARELNAAGMIMDFSDIKRRISGPLDHQVLNDVLPFNPTAENLAKHIYDMLQPYSFRVDVQESENNIASFVGDGV